MTEATLNTKHFERLKWLFWLAQMRSYLRGLVGYWTRRFKSLIGQQVPPKPDPRLESQGKLFKKAESSAEKLRLVYELYEDRIVDWYLDGAIKSRQPKLIRV
jgi:hypothetical protein